MTLGLPSWPTPLQALALVMSLRLGLRQLMQVSTLEVDAYKLMLVVDASS